MASGSAGPGRGAPQVMDFDLWVMLAVALACLPVFITGREIARWEGALFLALLRGLRRLADPGRAAHTALLATYATVMMSFVLPLTLVTLVVMLIAPGPRGR